MTNNLISSYVHYQGYNSKLVEVNDNFWQDMIDGKNPELEKGVLICQYSFSEDWTSWEKHPNGDELIVLLYGDADFIYKKENISETHRLKNSGDFVIIPKGAWHTAKIYKNSSMIFYTPGEGTVSKNL